VYRMYTVGRRPCGDLFPTDARDHTAEESLVM
jgi:hypothetical protein